MTNEAAYKARRGENLVQPGDVLLDGVCPLRENQAQKNELGSVIYKRILGQCFNLSLAGVSKLASNQLSAETRVPNLADG